MEPRETERASRVRSARAHPAGQGNLPPPQFDAYLEGGQYYSRPLVNTVLGLTVVFLMLGITIELAMLATFMDLLPR
jgi:hypothetical protein